MACAYAYVYLFPVKNIIIIVVVVVVAVAVAVDIVGLPVNYILYNINLLICSGLFEYYYTV